MGTGLHQKDGMDKGKSSAFTARCYKKDLEIENGESGITGNDQDLELNFSSVSSYRFKFVFTGNLFRIFNPLKGFYHAPPLARSEFKNLMLNVMTVMASKFLN